MSRLKRIVLRRFSVALGLFFPRHCAGCGLPVPRGWWCEKCRRELIPVRAPCCERCSHPFEGAITGRFLCPNCEGREFHFEVAVAVMRSRGPVRHLIHGLKYHSMTWAASPLAQFGFNGLADHRLGERPDFFVPVPLHPLRLRERGYNQSLLLARAIGSRAGIPVRDILRRIRPTQTQTHFNRARRMKNLKRAFALDPGAKQLTQGARILLLDDVLTTGSTFDECARVLLEAGADRVSALAIGRG